MGLIDLHIHTVYSDGTHTPAEVVALAQKAGLSAIAITDHDCVGGIKEAKQAADGAGVEVVTGIELSGEYNGVSLHILGYLFDENSQAIKRPLDEMLAKRHVRNRGLMESLNAAGVGVTVGDIEKFAGFSNASRTHFALCLMEKGVVSDINSAFTKYLSSASKCYVPFRDKTAEDAIRVIKAAGGVPVLAHPFIYGLDFGEIRKTVGELVEMGLMGIECFYPLCNKKSEGEILRLAERYDLFKTGGSDFHGQNRTKTTVGCVKINSEFLCKLRLRKEPIE